MLGITVLLSLLLLSNAVGTSHLTDHLACSWKFKGWLSLISLAQLLFSVCLISFYF